jgi:hypothetical protein
MNAVGSLRTMAGLLGVLALTLVGLAGSGGTAAGASSTRPGSGATRSASCTESPRGVPTTTWVARYLVHGTGDESDLRVTYLGRLDRGGRVVASPTADSWILAWDDDPEIGPKWVVGNPSQVVTQTVRGAQAELFTPDRACTVILSSTPPVAHHVAVIGDSIFAKVQSVIVTAGLPREGFAKRWVFEAESGYGWGAPATPFGNFPLTENPGTWVLAQARGLLAQHPRALVIELGADDALRAGFAASQVSEQQSLNAETKSDITTAVDEVARRAACTVLVTPSTYPTEIYGAGQRYSRQALRIDGDLRRLARSNGDHKVLIADWATLSASHHVRVVAQDSSSAVPWFPAGDNLHPNLAGEEALTGLVQQTVQRCSSDG